MAVGHRGRKVVCPVCDVTVLRTWTRRLALMALAKHFMENHPGQAA